MFLLPLPFKNFTAKAQKDFLYPAAVFLLAFFIRIIYLNQLNETPFRDCLLVDLEYYHSWAKKIAEGNLFGEKSPFEMTPLYAYFLAFLYKTLTTDLFVIRIIQIIFGSVGCVLICQITKDILNKKWAGLLAGIIACAYGPFVFYDGMIMKPFLGSFFTICTIYLFLQCEKKALTYWLYCGISLGLTALVRENVIVLIPAILLCLLCKNGFFVSKEKIIKGCCFLLGISFVIIPVTVRNGIAGGEWVLITSGGGEVFYISNNEHADGTYKTPPFVFKNPQYEHENFRQEAQRITKKKLTRREASYFWYEKGVDFITTSPLQFIKLTAKKFILFWNYYEFPDNKNYYFQKGVTPVLKRLLDFGHIAPFGFIGIIIAFFSFKRFYPLLILFFSYLASLLLLFNFSRFKLPAVFFIIIFGVYCLTWLLKKIQLKEYKLAGTVILSIVICNRITYSTASVLDPYTSQFDIAYANEAVCYELKGNVDKALNSYKQALNINPNSTRAQSGTGNIYLQKGLFTMAENAFFDVLNTGGKSFQAHNGLGILLMMKGKPGRAILEYKKALTIAPDNPLLLNNIGFAFHKMGLYEKALESQKKAIKKNPSLIKAYFGAAMAYEGLGDIKKAIAHYTYFIKKSNDRDWIKDAKDKISSLRMQVK